MNTESMLHALKDIGIELLELEVRINSLEKKLEKIEKILAVFANNQCLEGVKEGI